MNTEDFLLELCDDIHYIDKKIQEKREQEAFGDQFIPKFLVTRRDKVRIEIRKENVSHNTPHLHITHSDKIDVSISLIDFSILAGNIDRKEYKYYKKFLMQKKDKLIKIWEELNEKDNSIGVEKLIHSF